MSQSRNLPTLLAVASSDLEQFGMKPATIAELARVDELSPMMRLRKRRVVPPELIQQAIANNPLETVPRWQFTDEVLAATSFRQSFPELKTAFMQTHFIFLQDLGFAFGMQDQEIVEKTAKYAREKSGLTTHLQASSDCLLAFNRLFSFIDFIIEKGRFQEKHLTSLQTICTAFGALAADPVQAARLMKPISAQIAFNRDRYIFEIPTVLAMNNLPEILLAMPVCFLQGKGVRPSNDDDPQVSEAAKMICDLVGSRAFAWFYQIYNRRDRDIKGNLQNFLDPVPSDYLEFRTCLAPMIDLEMICTPYHHIASREWTDPTWLAGIDPIALGIQKGIPFVTIFKRWSGNGVFPLLPELMAGTIEHLTACSNKLSNFKNPYWYKAPAPSTYLSNSRMLTGFVNKIIEAFGRGEVVKLLSQGDVV